MNQSHHSPIISFNVPTKVSIIGISLLVLIYSMVPTAYAGGPVVCVSGSGNVTVNDFDLSTCGVPAENPLYVVLTVKSSSLLAQSQLSEGALSCQVTAPVGSYADCVVTVTDGTLDTYQTDNDPENYRLEVSWETPVITNTNTYTVALSSGDVAVIERSYTYGEKNVSGQLFYLSVLGTLAVIVFSILLLRLK